MQFVKAIISRAKKHQPKTGLVLALFFVSCAMYAQDHKADFLKARNFYRNSANLTMKVSVRGFASASDNKGYSLGTGVMHKSDKKYYSKFMHSEMLDDGKRILVIDHEQKQAVFSSGQSVVKAGSKMDESIDTLFSVSDSIKFIEKKDGIAVYQCFMKKGMISYYKISIQSSTGHLKRIEYVYRSNPDYDMDIYKVIVDYTEISPQKPVFPAAIDDYISEKSGKYILKGKIAGYRFEELKKNPYLPSLTNKN